MDVDPPVEWRQAAPESPPGYLFLWNELPSAAREDFEDRELRAGHLQMPTFPVRCTRRGIIPIARMADPQEIGKITAFVFRPSQASLNGAVLDVNGGSYIR